MRLRIVHETRYAYASPARLALQVLRLTPRMHEGQFVRHWRIEPDQDCRLYAAEDCFGNVTHSFTAEGPLDSLTVHVEGEVETVDTVGIVRGTIERFPPALFLRETELTAPDAAIRSFAEELSAREDGQPLPVLHGLCRAVNALLRFDIGGTTATTPAAEAFALGHGVCQDHAHVFIAAARCLGIPARYVSGYFHRNDDVTEQDAGHAWAEAHVAGLGWVGFDPANGISPTEAHVRVAVALDYLGAAPVRGARHGGGEETLHVHVTVEEARRQSQA